MEEPLAVLLLPSKLEQFEFEQHARALLAIPRVLALEPGRFRTPRFLRDAAPMRQAKRLKLPGHIRLVVLYHPTQYPLARALVTRYEDAELWYLRPPWEALVEQEGYTREDLMELDQLATERCTRILAAGHRVADAGEEIRGRMLELEIISHRPFVPGGRITLR